MSWFFLTAAQRVVPSPPIPDYTSVAASLTRYDGGTGTALFRGAIPLAPGVATTSAALDDIRVLVNGAEPAAGLWIEPTEYRHANGDIRSAYVEFEAACGSAETVVCEVRIGQARTTADRSAVTDAVERSPRSWHAAPTLFAITDPEYLCASRVAPLPLVPLDHPDIPASIVTWLTTTLDTWNATTNLGASTYDEQYALICRYLCTGDVADLAEALERNQSDNSPVNRQRLPFAYWIGDGATAWNGVDLNPSDYAKSTGDTNGAPNEPNDQSLTQLMVYALTGWEYSRIHIERNACATGFSEYRQSIMGSTTFNGNTLGYPRQAFRWWLQQGILSHTLRTDRFYDVGGGLTMYDGTDPYGTMAERVERMLDQLEAVNATIVPGSGGIPAWWTALLGVGADNIDGTIAICPNFQFVTSASLWMAHMNGADTRASIPTHLDAMASWARSQVVLNGTVYTAPYDATDPSALGTPTGGTLVSVMAWLFAWEYARTGNTTARDLYDAVCASSNLTIVGQGPETITRKVMGELWFMAFHAAALRAGVAWDAWEA